MEKSSVYHANVRPDLRIGLAAVVLFSALWAYSALANPTSQGDVFLRLSQAADADASSSSSSSSSSGNDELDSGSNQGFDARIALLDLSYIEQNSAAFQDFLPQFRELQQQTQEQIFQQEEDVKKFGSETEAQRTVLSPESYSSRVEQLNQRVAVLRQTVQNRARAMEDLLARARAVLLSRVTKVTVEVMSEKGIDVVMNIGGNASTVFTYANRLRIDEDVSARLAKEDFVIDMEALQQEQRESQQSQPSSADSGTN